MKQNSTRRSSWSMGKQLAACFGGLALILGVYGIFSQNTISKLGESQELIVNSLARKVVLVGELNEAAEQMRSQVRGMLLAAYSHEPAVAEKAHAAHEAAMAHFRKATADTESLADGDSERRIIRGLLEYVEKWGPAVRSFEKSCADQQLKEAEKARVEVLGPLAETVDGLTDQLRDEQVRDLHEAGKMAHASIARSRWLSIMLLGCSIGIGIAVAIFVRRITRGLKTVADQMFDQSEQVSNAAAQVSSSSQSLAQGASQQSASLEETSAATEQITSVAKNNDQASREAANVVTQSNQNVSVANGALEQMVLAMGEISDSSGKIAKIIRVIDEIAFQTNILALNAAVEAARAGEAGMGFAVVADEVRSLAQRSASAAKETAMLIEESIEKTTGGKARVDQLSGAIKAITADSSKVKTLVEHVSANSGEQTRGVDQVAKAIAQMQSVTQAAAASAEQSAAASEELSAQAEGMRRSAGDLRALVAGRSGGTSL